MSSPKNEEKPFDSAKESMVVALQSMVDQLQRLEQAVQKEDMAAVYQIYWQEMPRAIQQTSNTNHEVDDFLSEKLNQELQQKFPFMILREKASAVLLNYQIEEYYRARAILQIDITQPRISILPEARKHWQKTESGEYQRQLADLQAKEDTFNGNVIAAQTELKKLNEQLHQEIAKKEQLEATKTLLNRKKIEDEVQVITQKIIQLQTAREKWLPYEDKKEQEIEHQRLSSKKKELSLEQAIALKELRIIKDHFDSVEKMEEHLMLFIQEFLKEKVRSHE